MLIGSPLLQVLDAVMYLNPVSLVDFPLAARENPSKLTHHHFLVILEPAFQLLYEYLIGITVFTGLSFCETVFQVLIHVYCLLELCLVHLYLVD